MMDVFFGVQLAAFALILAAFPIIRLIRMAIDGELDGGMVALVIFLYLALIAAVAAGPSPVKMVALGFVAISLVGLPFLRSVAEARESRRMEDDRLRAYAAALERNPEDPVARIALAEELARRGDLVQAVEHMEWTLREHPKLAAQHQATLDDWRRRLETRPEVQVTICHMCHAEQPPDATHCSECGAAFGTVEGA